MALTGFPSRPIPSEQELKQLYVGKDISEVPKPAVVLDIATIKRNCDSMLKMIKQLDVGFRAHIKTHKTTQVAQLQVGTESEEVNFIASTVLEIEMLVPLIKNFNNMDVA